MPAPVPSFLVALPAAPVAPLTRGLPPAARRPPRALPCASAAPSPTPWMRVHTWVVSQSRAAAMQPATARGGGGAGAGGGSSTPRDGAGRRWWDDDGSRRRTDAGGLWLVLGGLLARYSRSLVVRPYRTKAATSGLLMMLSDYLAQVLTSPVLELARLLRFLFYGVVVAGPVTHWWFAQLERVVRARGLFGAVQMAALDQFVGAPVLLAAFVLFMHVADGRPIAGHEHALREQHAAAFLASARVWPLVNVLNFALVPPQYRVVIASAFNVVWVAFLSISTNPTPSPLDDLSPS